MNPLDTVGNTPEVEECAVVVVWSVVLVHVEVPSMTEHDRSQTCREKPKPMGMERLSSWVMLRVIFQAKMLIRILKASASRPGLRFLTGEVSSTAWFNRRLILKEE